MVRATAPAPRLVGRETLTATKATFDAEFERLGDHHSRYCRLHDETQAGLDADEPLFETLASALERSEEAMTPLRTHPLIVTDEESVRLRLEASAARRAVDRLVADGGDAS